MDWIILIDHHISNWARQLGGVSAQRDQIVDLLANWLPFVVIAVGLILIVRGADKQRKKINRHTVLLGLLTVALVIPIRNLLAYAIDRPRPFLRSPELHSLPFSNPNNPSMPSGHAIELFAFIGVLFFVGHHPRWATLLLIISVIVVSARVVAGYHYPSDIIVGAALGLLAGRLAAWQSRHARSRQSA